MNIGPSIKMIRVEKPSRITTQDFEQEIQSTPAPVVERAVPETTPVPSTVG